MRVPPRLTRRRNNARCKCRIEKNEVRESGHGRPAALSALETESRHLSRNASLVRDKAATLQVQYPRQFESLAPLTTECAERRRNYGTSLIACLSNLVMEASLLEAPGLWSHSAPCGKRGAGDAAWPPEEHAGGTPLIRLGKSATPAAVLPRADATAIKVLTMTRSKGSVNVDRVQSTALIIPGLIVVVEESTSMGKWE